MHDCIKEATDILHKPETPLTKEYLDITKMHTDQVMDLNTDTFVSTHFFLLRYLNVAAESRLHTIASRSPKQP